MQCQRTGCEAEATDAPVLVIPPVGGSPTQLGRLRAIVGLQLCRACCTTSTVSDMLTEEAQHRMADAMVAQRRRAPDFARAMIEAIPIAGGEFQAFLRTTRL